MASPLRPPASPWLRAQLQRGAGARVWDTAGKSYLDFHAGYATLNQGHCHPTIVRALQEQSEKLTLTSTALPHNRLAAFAERLTSTFDYACIIPMNSGTEACETAVKYARRWGYEKKRIPENAALVVVPEGTYSGHSFAALSASSEPELRRGFGPYLPGFVQVPYGDTAALAEALAHPHVAALLLEPIQGEAGVVLPPAGYLPEAKKICERNRVLFIADEVQTGLGRTGTLTACAREGVRPDLLVIGKALSGGMFPISAVLCDAEVGDVVGVEEHNSTFSASPLACHVATAALEVITAERLAERAERLGNQFRETVAGWKFPWLTEVRGCGLLNAVELAPDFPVPVWAVSRALEEEGILSLPLTKHALRFSPPLVISEAELATAFEKIERALRRAAER